MKKNFLIIGGSSGIGKELVKILSEQGHQVYATYHKNEVTSTENCTYFSWNIEEKFPIEKLPERLDGVAYMLGAIQLKPFARLTEKDFLNDYQLQVVGAVKILQEVFPKLKKAENASVVLFSTVAAQKGFPFHTLVSASKGAIEGLTHALSAEWAPTIRVNAIAPSLTDTPLAATLLSNDAKKEAQGQRHPMGRIGQPEDIAQMASFLLSNQSSWITGQIFSVDGGISTINK